MNAVKTNHRRRMQTRSRRISDRLPWWSDPIEHNASVARRKQLREFDKRITEIRRASRRLALGEDGQ
jgi:hypothetical protein